MRIIEDTNLILSILDGDKKSEKILYDKYKKIVEDYIKSKYPNNYNTDDDVSEILIKIFTSLPSYDFEKSKFKSWVFTITKNYMIDKSRHLDILNGTITLDGLDDNITFTNHLGDSGNITWTSENNNVITYTSSYATDFENCDVINHISNHVESCDFTFLNMKYSQGYDYNEIGIEFNMTSNTVSNRVNYVKSKIKKCLNIKE